jgi:predicted ATP-dependent protease
VREEIAFHPVETVDEVLAIALEREPDTEATAA